MYELQTRGAATSEEAREVICLPDQVSAAIRGLMGEAAVEPEKDWGQPWGNLGF
jgi:hypothetical protein